MKRRSSRGLAEGANSKSIYTMQADASISRGCCAESKLVLHSWEAKENELST